MSARATFERCRAYALELESLHRELGCGTASTPMHSFMPNYCPNCGARVI